MSQNKQGNTTQSPKGKKRRRKSIPWVVIILFICFVIIGLAGVQLIKDWAVPLDAENTQVVDIEIPSGATVDEMGSLLEDEDIIRSGRMFKIYVKVKDVAPSLQAGVHSLSPSMSLAEVVANLQEGAKQAGVSTIAVIEGLTIEQIAEVVDANTSYSKADFLALMRDDEFLGALVQDYPFLEESYNNPQVRYVLEGYLFPATYDFREADGLASLVYQMVEVTSSVLEKYQAEIDASEYSLQELMALASLVEKEGMTTEDRKLIAGVFYNRLAQGMAIQSDISVLYALGTHKEMVTFEDLEVDSPYNLYQNTGLPPGPLNNPSEDAIAAVLAPTDNDYIYFYANLKTGEVFFTDDYDQHLAWQKEYEETGDIKR